MAMAFISRACCRSAFRIILLLLLFAFICIACVCLPVEKILQEFLLWIKQDLGPWGPVVMTAAYTPLAIFAIPTSILSLGGGYLYGLPLGFAIDSVGATVGATAAFLIGRTAVTMAIQKSGFKIVFLLRLAPLLPFTVLNYFLSVAPVHIGEYMLASWLGIMPSTFAFVYVGTTLTDLSDVMHGWNEISTTRRVLMALGFVMSVILIMCITKVAKASLDKALVENSEKRVFITTMLPIVVDSSLEVQKPLIQIGLREEEEENEKQRLI
ncbi:TVP38/TMEM64 family membrane protein slr0305-like isoform X3 [Mangifera indica]|uniref:TVP38/TMEM64 family membrane protein slr0305-like isoform X3 n=1 Tax=Mangifera indica TaxID=29780 RepID=UPI001CFB17BA|nr:TVP38/TMEM64 family membrane protein slr0305-like isoform X3 [Mangifera indica]